jgi:hypothetical protein
MGEPRNAGDFDIVAMLLPVLPGEAGMLAGKIVFHLLRQLLIHR